MSSPSTPARSSRASSAASTPSMRASRSPIELTPRSKVKAMLAGAGLSDDSEGELTSKPSANTTKPTETTSRTPASAPISAMYTASSDSEEDDDIPVRKPVGRMAARMLGQSTGDASSDNNDGEANAYERVKKMLMEGSNKQKEVVPARERPIENAESSSGEELPVKPATTKRIARGTRKPSEAPRSTTPASRRSSPGLFVSPSRPSPAKSLPERDAASDTDSDIPDPFAKSRLEELVARKRAERKEREEKEKEENDDARRKSRAAARKSRREESMLNGAETDSDDGEEVSKKLTQQSRPTRKASKKAIEEMNRETQRMNRNMQLAHQARTKKKFTTKDLFARFKYGQAKDSEKEAQQGNTTASSIAASSDVEHHDKETPPSSPPSTDELSEKAAAQGVDTNGFPEDTVVDIGQNIGNDEELPDLDTLSLPRKKIDKGKRRADGPEKQEAPKLPTAPQPRVSVPMNETRTKALRVVLPERTAAVQDPDSDDDLEIVKDTRFPVFDNLPARKAREPDSLLRLRHLAHLTSPSKTRQKGGHLMNPIELQNTLQRRAREQAKREKEEKLAELRARGIVIQTEEEREKDQLELENLLEKARKEAQELAQKEKEAAKKEGKESDENALPDSEDDESYVEEEEDDGELQLSGSEDEEDEAATNDEGLLDNEADEDEDEEEGEEMADEEMVDADAQESEHEDAPMLARRATSARNRKRVIDDDEDEDNEPKAAASQPRSSPAQDETMAAFGFNAAAPVGLSQMFAGTMVNMESQPEAIGHFSLANTQQDSIDFFKDIPLSTIPNYASTVADDSQDSLVRDSQRAGSQAAEKDSQQINIGISQFPSQGEYPDTQMSDMPDPTQDNSFTISRTPGRLRAPASTHETVDTVILPVDESPVIKKKGRLQRRVAVAPDFSDVDEEVAQGSATESDTSSDEEFEISANAFDVMRKGAKKAKKVELFDKKKSGAKEMVDEQAEESEDEYAGLGGASDDESGGEMDEELKQMIEDGDIKVNEREIAAFYADKERAEDEKRIDKLYKDITNGGLRRKRAGDFELSDSEDEAAERRRRKQREFTRMRRALLEDENIGKIAENPKKMAFLRALEDHEEEDDLNFLEVPEENSQSQSVPDSQEAAAEAEAPQAGASTSKAPANPLKRKGAFADENDENRPPAALRRTKESSFRKPTTLAEIRESVSFLIDEPLVKETQFSDASEDEDASDQHGEETSNAARALFAARRTNRGPIVDRLTLAHSSSSNLSNNSVAAGEPMAFLASKAPGGPGFRVPSLLRRAATNLSATSETGTTYSNGSSGASNGAGGSEGAVRRGGSKKSNIHYQAREAERKKVVEAAEQRRKEGLRKKVFQGGKRSVLGMLGGASGGFE